MHAYIRINLVVFQTKRSGSLQFHNTLDIDQQNQILVLQYKSLVRDFDTLCLRH